MKQAEDTKTIDMLGRPRGRPRTGEAMTAAARKRKSRDAATLAAIYCDSPEKLTMTGIMAALPKAVAAKNISVVSRLTDELKRRARETFD
ncbi:MAG: hypothetical protein ACYCWC_01700 [Rhodocyclaceae bacterium]